jgi:hypothetical protein
MGSNWFRFFKFYQKFLDLAQSNDSIRRLHHGRTRQSHSSKLLYQADGIERRMEIPEFGTEAREAGFT